MWPHSYESNTMVCDLIEHATRYFGYHPRFERAFTWLRTTDLHALPTGRTTLDGDRLFANVDEYTTRPIEPCRLEAHRRYLDIQYMVRGVEQIGYTVLDGLDVLVPYDESRDVGFYKGGFDRFTLREGMFAVFAPHDAHAPQIAAAEPIAVRKIVVKVAL